MALFLQSARTDGQSGDATARFAAQARGPLAVKLVMDATGGHRMDSWAAHVDQALLWLASVRPAFRAA